MSEPWEIIGYEEDGTPVINCPACQGVCFVEIDLLLEAVVCPECNGNGDIALPSVH